MAAGAGPRVLARSAGDRHDVDYRRITLSNARLAGQTVAELGLEERFGAHATRVRRGDLDMHAHDELIAADGRPAAGHRTRRP